jgi:hypothetical protein
MRRCTGLCNGRGIGVADERDRHYGVLHDRCRYLELRIEAKQKLGWETQYDEAERAALEWALDQLLEAAWPEETYDSVQHGHLQGDDLA